jgi:hypothetical protein
VEILEFFNISGTGIQQFFRRWRRWCFRIIDRCWRIWRFRWR